MFLRNARYHRWLPVARADVRRIALFDFIFLQLPVAPQSTP